MSEEVLDKLELLEERSDALMVQDDQKQIMVMDKNPYNLLKYKFYRGNRIRFMARGVGTIALQESDADGVFECAYNGSSVTIENSEIQVASAIFDAHENGNLDAIYSLWKLKYVEKFLDISVVLEANSPAELTREGKLFLPRFASLEILEWMERADGGRVVKVEFSRGPKSLVDRIFTHEIKVKSQTRVMVNETAVALIGRDETGQCWMHVVPPEYRSRSIGSCEMWLCEGKDEGDELIDALTSIQ